MINDIYEDDDMDNNPSNGSIDMELYRTTQSIEHMMLKNFIDFLEGLDEEKYYMFKSTMNRTAEELAKAFISSKNK